MSQQMNQYSVVFNEVAVKDEQGKNYDIGIQAAALAISVTSWLLDQKINFVGGVTANKNPGITLNTTEDAIKQITDAFKAQIASVQLLKENVITIPDAYKKKTRRPGFEG